ncbi:uncharacterized protein LJ206_005523 [Theristicus caerulescens]
MAFGHQRRMTMADVNTVENSFIVTTDCCQQGRAECPTEVPGPPRQGVLTTPQAQPTFKLRPGAIIQDMIFPDLSRHSQIPSTVQELVSDIYKGETLVQDAFTTQFPNKF